MGESNKDEKDTPSAAEIRRVVEFAERKSTTTLPVNSSGPFVSPVMAQPLIASPRPAPQAENGPQNSNSQNTGTSQQNHDDAKSS